VLPDDLLNDPVFMSSLAEKKLVAVKRFFKGNQSAHLDPICACIGVTAGDMPSQCSEDGMREKLLKSTTLALVLARNFPEDKELVSLIRGLQQQLQLGSVVGDVMNKEYKWRRADFKALMVRSLPINWAGLHEFSHGTVAVAAMVILAKLLMTRE
jgi:hypothetical protein